MRKLFLLLFIGSSLCPDAQKQKHSTIIPGQYIVVLKESFAMPVVKTGLNTNRKANAPNKELRNQNVDKLKKFQARLKLNASGILYNYTNAIVGFATKLSEAEVNSLQKDPAVAGIYQDHKIQLSYTIKSETNTSPITQVEDCAVATAGGHVDGSSKFTWIWILDTGLDTDHPDLNVQAHAPYAVSFVGSPFEDINGHGTHVAGIAAAKDNGEGVVGVSAGAKVVPVKVLDDNGQGEISGMIAGLDHVAQYSIPGDVVNISLGWVVFNCSASGPSVFDAVANLADAGVWVCIAAGNNSDNAELMLPGCINYKRVLTVAALGCGNTCAAFSNLGNNVDWFAVGEDVYSTSLNGGYATLSGTSMATPVVAGIVHSRGQAPIRGPEIICSIPGLLSITKNLAIRQ